MTKLNIHSQRKWLWRTQSVLDHDELHLTGLVKLGKTLLTFLRLFLHCVEHIALFHSVLVPVLFDRPDQSYRFTSCM